MVNTRTPPAEKPKETSPATIERPDVEIEAAIEKQRDDASLLPAILAGHSTPAIAEKVNRFDSSVGEIFGVLAAVRLGASGSYLCRIAARTPTITSNPLFSG